MNTQTITSANQVAEALTSLKLDMPSRDALAAISRVCREDFLADITTCREGRDGDGAARSRLERIIGCTAEKTCAAVASLNLSLTLDDLVNVARKIPVRFLSAVAAATDASSPRRNEARQYLEGIAVSKPWATPVAPVPALPPEAPMAQSGKVQDSPPPAMPEPPPYEAANAAPQRADPAARRPAQQGSSRDQSGEASRNYRSAHVYGSGYALCFNAVTGQDGVPGVMVDAAASAGPKAYDWAGAIHIMLDVREVACVLAVFRNWRRGVEFNAHGRNNDKSFAIERQGAHYYCKVSAKRQGGEGGMRGVRILPVDAHKVAMLFLEQLLLAYPSLPPSEVIALARSINTDEIPARTAAG